MTYSRAQLEASDIQPEYNRKHVDDCFSLKALDPPPPYLCAETRTQTEVVSVLTASFPLAPLPITSGRRRDSVDRCVGGCFTVRRGD